MSIEHLASAAAALLPKNKGNQPQRFEPIPGLALLNHPVVTSFESTLYEPVCCLIVQGGKSTTVGDETFRMGPGDCLLISHDLPVVSRVTKARYLAVIIKVDVSLLRSLYDEVADTGAALDASEARAVEVHRATPQLIECMSRYVALASAPADAKVLGPPCLREIHYRLLTAPFGGMLRRLLRHDSQESAIARAISRLRTDFRAPIAIPQLAKDVGMSVSSFHKHFRAVTSSTPLQFQKDLRLLAARSLIARGEASVSAAAFDVGYESPNQFSREYRRKFGVTPRESQAPVNS